MQLTDKKFTVPRSSSRKEFIKSLDASIKSFDNMAKSLNNEDMLINIENIPSEAFDLISISTTYNVYINKLIKIFNDNRNVNLLIDYANLLEKNTISKSKMNDTSKIMQKYSQEMNILQKNNKNLKNIEIKLNKEKQKKALAQVKKAQTTLKRICKKYKQSLSKSGSITPTTFNNVLSIKNGKGLLSKLNNIKFKIQEIIDVYIMNKRIQLQKRGFFAKIINSLKSLKNYFSRKYRIRKIFNYIQKNQKGISKSIEKIKFFFRTINKNFKSLKLKATGSFDRNFTYLNLKSVFENMKYRVNNIYSDPKMSKSKNIKNMIYDVMKSNSMPQSKSEKDLFMCLICIKMINYLFAVLNIEDSLENINNLSKIKLKQIIDLKTTFEMFKIVLTILSIIVTIASFVLPWLGVVGTPLWGTLIKITL